MRGRSRVTVARRVLQDVAQALAYAHAKGVIHRDVKPDNILLDGASGRALVTDFGIAKALEGPDPGITQSGEIVGTARYMAPEQVLGVGLVDARADMYALGLVGYFILSGQHAIKGTTLPAVIAEHVKGGVVSVRAMGRQLPAQLVTPLERCLEPKAEQRYARMEEFVEALRDLGAELPDVPAPVRKLLRESERAFVVTTLTAFALGLFGAERVPPAMIVLLGSAILAQWTVALEQASRHGVTWSGLRRALYVERARRVEEVEQVGGNSDFGPLSFVTFVLLVGAIVLLGQGDFGRNTPVNLGLFGVGTLGGIVAARIFGIPGVSDKGKHRSRRIVAFSGFMAIVTALLLGFLAGAGAALQDASPVVAAFVLLVWGGLGALTAYTGWRWLKRYEERKAALHVQDLARAAEWRLPRWLDVVGSWLFARFVRGGGRVRLEREPSAAVHSVSVDVSAARAALRRLSSLYRRAPAAVSRTAFLARQLGEDLVAECRRAARELKPLDGKIARLSEGVLVSRTIMAGGSVEGELDHAEREADLLRARGRECLEMLTALVVGLEAAVVSQDTAALDEALRRAREFSSAVRKKVGV